MSGRFKTKQQTYINKDHTSSRSVIHPLIEVDGEFVFITDNATESGLAECKTREQARAYAVRYLEEHKTDVQSPELWSEEEQVEADAAALRSLLMKLVSALELRGETETADSIRSILDNNEVGKDFLSRASLNENALHRVKNYFDSLTKNESGVVNQIVEEAIAGIGADNYADATDPLDLIMCVDDAAKLWGYHPSYIKNLCASGIIRAQKYGKTWIIDKRQNKPKYKK